MKVTSKKIVIIFYLGFFSLSLLCLHFLAQGNIIHFKRLALQALAFRDSPKDISHVSSDSLQFYALKKSLHYNELAKAHFLQRGMIINRDYLDNVIDTCDSLLFSALRLTALKKLGLSSDAEAAFSSLRPVLKNGVIKRHLDCFSYPSRDMFLGALIALHHKKKENRNILEDLIAHLERHQGYFAEGPMFVSFMTPNLALLMRLVALNQGIDPRYKALPLKYSVGAPELTSLLIEPGYEAHLLALSLWLEMEIITPQNTQGQLLKDRSPILKVMSPFLGQQNLQENLSIRWAWISQQLMRIDAHNLFFEYLYYKSMGTLNHEKRLELLRELVSMTSAFPDERLPCSSDRKADYMWQRSSREYTSQDKDCLYYFSGTDWLWLASLLLEDMPSKMVLPGE